MKVSELIKIEGIKNWDKGDIITIKAGMGKGKSYFIKNMLYAFAKAENKKILMLIHRLNCTNQFKQEIRKDKKADVIEINTYQAFEYMIKNGHKIDFSRYEYIVCDEFHYFLSDAAFNRTTDISLNAILEQTDKVRIFMSATSDEMKGYISKYRGFETTNYELPINYSFIKELAFFNKDETMEKLIEEAIETGDKAIFFIQSAKKAYNIYRKYKKYALFNCSESNKEYYKYVDRDKITDMLVNERFEKQVLITTTTMDAGVNIKDTDVKHIICDVEDVGVLIQCLGRRRISNKIEDDGIYVYVKNITNRQLGGRETQAKAKLKKAEYFKEHGGIEYVKKYGRDPDRFAIVYSEVDDENIAKKLNEMAYFKLKIDIATIQLMKQSNYVTYISDLFGKKYEIIEKVEEKEVLEQYLEKIKDKRLYHEEQQKLSDLVIGELVTISKKVDYRTSKLKPSTLESIIRNQLELKYAVSEIKREDKIVDGERIRRNYIVISKIA